MALNLGGIDKVLLDKISKLPTFALVALAIVFISSATGIATLSVSTTTTSVNLAAEDFVLDADSAVANATISKSPAGASANGQSQGTAEEATPQSTGLASLNTDLTSDNFIYKFDITESGTDTWPDTRVYQIEVFLDGQLADTLYLENSTAVSTVEGVTVSVDLGDGDPSGDGDLPDAITVKVLKLVD